MSHLTEGNALGRPAVNRTSFWNQYGDPTLTRSSVATIYIPEALATGNFEVRADSFVREVRWVGDGKATGVVYIDPDGAEIEQEARVVILALGAIESARLMLLSSSNRFPDGLANDSGLVGKNATFHEYIFAVGLFDRDMEDPVVRLDWETTKRRLHPLLRNR
jgi:choline dehydrogenase-like flavoprotein